MKKTEKCYTNRELSWLQFNERVLNEAGNPRVPLAERMTLHPFTRQIWMSFHGARGHTHDADECKRKGN